MSEYKEVEFENLLTKEDFFKLIEAVRRNGKVDEAEAERLVIWTNHHLAFAEIAKLMIDGFFVVSSWDAEGNPNVIPTDEAIQMMGRMAEGKALEESICR